MKKIQVLAVAIATTFAMTAAAQIESPQPSPKGEVEAMVGLTEIEVEYSRPGMKEREIFGKLVPYGEIWRTGANASTKFKTDKDIMIAGKELKAGEYALYTIPGETEWTIIFHNNLTYWGVGDYKKEEDALRVTVKPMKLQMAVETFTIEFSHFTMSGAKLMILWEQTGVAIDIETKLDEQMQAQIKETLIDGPGAGDYRAGAMYYMEKGENLEQALTWMTKACDMRPDAFWMMMSKAELLKKMGKTKEAKAAAEKTIEVAKESKRGDFGYIKKAEEFIAGLK